MIITRMSGGLGNQMFQYAIGLNLAIRNNDEMKIDATGYQRMSPTSIDTVRSFDLDKFNITKAHASHFEINLIKYPHGFLSKINRLIQKKVLKKYYIDFYPTFLNRRGNVYIDGFFQSEKNFLEIESLIRKEFSLKQEYVTDLVKKFSEKISSCNSVSIHIRRGDVANNPKTNKYHGLCPISYYEQAISYVATKVTSPHFFVFSDNIDWVKENLKISHPHTFVSGNNLISQQEMHLMSKCKHNIIANSTFSWWGAWLNENPNKIVVAPKKWVNIEPNPHQNILPETWTTI